MNAPLLIILVKGIIYIYIYIYIYILKRHYKEIEKSILHKRMMVKKIYENLSADLLIGPLKQSLVGTLLLVDTIIYLFIHLFIYFNLLFLNFFILFFIYLQKRGIII